MQCTLDKTNRRYGFTLVEVLIISPMIILVIAGILALIINLTGNVLQSGEATTITHDTQEALDQIERDVRTATSFATQSLAPLNGQGWNDGTTVWKAQDHNALILNIHATDKNPYDSTRQLIYQPAASPVLCTKPTTPFMVNVIYYVKNNELWRRTLVPSHTAPTNPCAEPWQRRSCSPGYTSPSCQTEDARLLSNLDTNGWSMKYYEKPGSPELPLANLQAATITEVTLKVKKTVAGRAIDHSGALRVAKANSTSGASASPLYPPAKPSVGSNTYITSGALSVRFYWGRVPDATSYDISYRINNGNWTNVSSVDTYYAVPAYHDDTVDVKVAARNAAGVSPIGTNSRKTPRWTNCSLPSGWNHYRVIHGSSQYPDVSYTKTRANIVMLNGLIARSSALTVSSAVTICTLPEGYRPDSRLMFQIARQGGHGRVDILPTGEVNIMWSGSAVWWNLSSISFVASGSYSWSTLSGASGWTHYPLVSPPYSNVKATKDSLGRTHIQGLARGGTTTAGTVAFNLPTGYTPPNTDIYPASSSGTFNQMQISGSTGANPNKIQARGVAYTDHWSLQAISYDNTTTGWTTPGLSNGWIAYNTASFSGPQYKKSIDNIVSLRGLIKSGSVTAGSTIFTLPVGHRPSKDQICDTVTYPSNYARIDVTAAGAVIVREYVNSTWVSLAGCDFIAEQ